MSRRRGKSTPRKNDLAPHNPQPPRPTGQTHHEDEPRRSRQMSASVSYSELYAGPLPPPSVLQQFDEIVPGSAKLIIETFVKQTDHRQNLENMVIRNEIIQARWGLVAGFVIGLIGMTGGVYLGTLGYAQEGALLAGTTLAGLAGVFVYGTRSRRAERENKSKDNP